MQSGRPSTEGRPLSGPSFETSSEASGLGRESLYKALAPGAKVRYETVRKLEDSLGVKLTVTT